MPQLTAILDEIFCGEPMPLGTRSSMVSTHVRRVRGPQELINDPQLQANDIIVPLMVAGGKLTSTISSPLQVHGVAKVPASAPEDWRTQRRGAPAARIQRDRNRWVLRATCRSKAKGTCG